MSLGDKLFQKDGWSSKKYNGTVLILSAVVLAVVALVIYATVDELSMVELMIPSGSLLTSGLGCFGIDSVNKKTKSNVVQA